MQPRRNAATLAALSLMTLALAAQSHAAGRRVETVFVPTPVETVLAVPTTYVASTYVTTAAVRPTYYLPTTAYVMPTTAYLVPTVRYSAARPLFLSRAVERPLVTTSRLYSTVDLVPTYYTRPLVTTSRVYYDLTPTVYADSVVATSYDPCCEPAVAMAPTVSQAPLPAPAPAVSSQVRPQAPSSRTQQAPVQADRPPSRVIESEPTLEPVPQASQGATSPVTLPPATGATEAERSTAPPAGASTSPPAPTSPLDTPAPTSPLDTPAPASGIDLPPPAPAESEQRYEARRPVLTNEALRPVVPSLTALRGLVVASGSERPEEGVTVIVSDQMRRFRDRSATTDAQGRYQINLPDGDWRVQVAGASGRLYEVSRITVSGGQIIDDQDRQVPRLLITR